MPQNAEPTENRLMPDAVTINVTSAASRSFDSVMAIVRPLMIEPKSARAAIDSTSSLGKAANKAASVDADDFELENSLSHSSTWAAIFFKH